jgi:fucokinase
VALHRHSSAVDRRCQVGGLYPGFKMCRSAAQLPLRVVTEPLAIPAATVALINKHLVLCYSGQARLARNLLQGVLRRWFGRLPEVCMLTTVPPPRRAG